MDKCPICDCITRVPINVIVSQCSCLDDVCLHCFRDKYNLNDRIVMMNHDLHCSICNKPFWNKLSGRKLNMESITKYKMAAKNIYLRDSVREQNLDNKYGPIECPRKCGVKFLRTEFDSHIQICTRKRKNCTWCNRGYYDDNHLATCPKRPVPCSFCSKQISLSHHKSHKKNECIMNLTEETTIIKTNSTHGYENSGYIVCRIVRTDPEIYKKILSLENDLPREIVTEIVKNNYHSNMIGVLEYSHCSCSCSYECVNNDHSDDIYWYNNVNWSNLILETEFYDKAINKLRLDGVGKLSKDDCDYIEWNYIYTNFINMYDKNDWEKRSDDLFEEKYLENDY